jgi:glycosyltransferase involved in cell wall biosynthesis
LFTKKKRAIVSVINDLATDNRVKKTCNVLLEIGYTVHLIGRKLPGSLSIADRPYKCSRMSLILKSGPLFYAFFNLRLFIKLLFTRADLLFANDLDTLLPNYLVSRIKNIPLIYDSHELFCEVPELSQSPRKKKFWEKLEKAIVPKLKICITVNESIAGIFNEKYNIPFEVVRNIPEHSEHAAPPEKQTLGIPSNFKLIIMQGAGINIDRGAEELIDAMEFVNDAVLFIIGGGDVWNLLEEKVKKKELEKKVRLISKIPREKLLEYTSAADLGISIDKNTNPNYYYSLPNKLFDYIHSGTPVLASRLPEIEKIITHYTVGEFIENHNPLHIAQRINELLGSPQLHLYAANTQKAAKVLNWENEKKKYLTILQKLPS